ncbi:hypothetical protein HY486_00975 [Candidatus Woesearchaeota archaeon]|nr:hypothetical protein [Candidatus Woesearchaeota archaeon]
MASIGRLLVEAGFGVKRIESDYPGFAKFSPEKKKTILDEVEKKNAFGKYVDADVIEATRDQMIEVAFPKPTLRYMIHYETPHLSIEPLYSIILNLLRDTGFGHIEKVRDIFTASEQSSFYGAGAQRLGLAQDKASQYLATIGQFIRRDLFQLVRDIRWIQERLDIHEKARKENKEGEDGELTLKGLWVDLVDGVFQGQRTAANLFQMATQLQFSTLPDFFFSLRPRNEEEINKLVDDLEVNITLKNVLKRKLLQYIVWRRANYDELKQRKQFELKYLRQHYNIINMYLAWLRPYLKHIERMRSHMRLLENPRLVTAFEGSMAEIEIVGVQRPEGAKNIYNCLLVTIEYSTKPAMSFQQEGYHRGPIHVGEARISWRLYQWTAQDIENFKTFRTLEDVDRLEAIDESVKQTMNAIGEDLKEYLALGGENVGDPKKSRQYEKAKEIHSMFLDNPSKARRIMEEKGIPSDIIDDFVKESPDVFTPFRQWKTDAKSMIEPFKIDEIKKFFGWDEKKNDDVGSEAKRAEGLGKIVTFLNYKLFKKATGMPAW